MNAIIKAIVRICIPLFVRKLLRKLYKRVVSGIERLEQKREYKKIRIQQCVLRDKLRTVSGTRKIRVSFFLVHESVWQYDSLYCMMKDGSLFDPVIIVAPYTVYGRENMILEMNKAYTSFMARGYSVVKSYDEESNTWIDVKKDIDPDLVFFTNPHKLTTEEYYIRYWVDSVLTYYVPYSLEVSNLYKEQYNQYFHNVLWGFFCTHEIHKDISKHYSSIKGKNVIVVGYPKIDYFLTKTLVDNDYWKKQTHSKKRIIWSPHHTINTKELLNYSDFLINSQLILDLAAKYKELVQFAFKPHPILKAKLIEHPEWGEERTSKYFEKWKNGENTQLCESDYIGLFSFSDAIINSSGSFIAEYLMVGKPSALYVGNEDMMKQFNEFGKNALSGWYHIYNKEELIEFIDAVVLSGNDPKKKDREKFYNKYLLPPNGRTASENIYRYILNELEIE